MKKVTFFLPMLFSLLTFWATAQQPFTPGNLVVLRVGTGAAPLSTAIEPVFLDEYTTAGVLVQSIPMPTAVNGANQRFTLNGLGQTVRDQANSETGALSLSVDGHWLSAAGYSVPVSTTGSAANLSIERTIGLIDYVGNINTTTQLTNVGINRPFAAVSTNGTDLWAAFNDSTVVYTTTGNTSSVNLINNTSPGFYRSIGISNGQLYIGQYTNRVRAVGTGLPTTAGQTVVSLPGTAIVSAITEDQSQFFFADINPAIVGNDVLYIVSPGIGLRKYSFNGSSWVSNGIIGSTADNYFGITGAVTGTTIQLYITSINTPLATPDPEGGEPIITPASPNGGGTLVTLIDASGYNGSLAGTPTVLATAALQTSFRGVAFAPVAPQAASVKVAAKIFLQGAYNSSVNRHKDVTTGWAAILNTNALNQPYNIAAFDNYAGTESVSSGFFTSTGAASDITDWVLVELRDENNPAVVVSRRAAFVREDGRIVDLDGVSDVTFSGAGDGNYYIMIRHRNHLSVRSATTVALNSSTTSLYDFTTSQSQAFQNSSITSNAAMASKDLFGANSGNFLMWGGNANGDGLIRASGDISMSDYLTLLGPAALQGSFSKIISNVYRREDMNLDGVVRASARSNVNDYLLLMSPGILNGNTSNIITAH